MRCRQAKKILSDYIDGRIAGTLKTDLEAHLKECKICIQELIAFKKTDELVKLKTTEHPSAEYWNNYWPTLKDKLEQTASAPVLTPEFAQDRKWFPVFIPRFGLALNMALIVLLILSVGMLYRSNKQINTLRVALSKKTQTPKITVQTDTQVPVDLASELPTEQAIRKQLKIFHEVKDMFPKTIRWVVSSNGNIDLGLATPGLLETASTEDENPIFLQFSILRHARTTEVVSSPMIMVYSGHEVNTKLNGLSKADQTIYRYQCLPELDADGKIDLLVRISLDGSVLETTLSAPEGEKIEIGRLRKRDAEYSVYITIRSQGLNITRPGSKQI